MRRAYTQDDALAEAIVAAKLSPCQKSQRGAAVFHREHGLLATGWNHQPEPFVCDRSLSCSEHCNKLCVHAEEAALLALVRSGRGLVSGSEVVHVKLSMGHPVPSGLPSCWQCSRKLLELGLVRVWLLHERGLVDYPAKTFHELTLRHHRLPCKILEPKGPS